MPWSGRAGSAYSQMEVADGRRLTIHRSCFVRFPLADAAERVPARLDDDSLDAHQQRRLRGQSGSRVRAAQNEPRPRRSITSPRTTSTFSGSSGSSKRALAGPNGHWPSSVPSSRRSPRSSRSRVVSRSSGAIKGAELVGRPYRGPFDDLPAQNAIGGVPADAGTGRKDGGQFAPRDRRRPRLAGQSERGRRRGNGHRPHRPRLRRRRLRARQAARSGRSRSARRGGAIRRRLRPV